MSVRAALAAAALAALCAGCGASSQAARQSRFEGKAIPAGTSAQDFALRDQNGRLIKLSEQRGRLVLLAFLYTHCTDICPLIANALDTAVRSLGPDAASVRILAVSVDPAGDTPTLVRRYVREHRLGPEFHWLLGTQAQLAPVWQDYNVLVEGRPADKVVHSGPVFLIDRSGRPRLFYAPLPRESAYEHDLRALLGS